MVGSTSVSILTYKAWQIEMLQKIDAKNERKNNALDQFGF